MIKFILFFFIILIIINSSTSQVTVELIDNPFPRQNGYMYDSGSLGRCSLYYYARINLGPNNNFTKFIGNFNINETVSGIINGVFVYRFAYAVSVNGSDTVTLVTTSQPNKEFTINYQCLVQPALEVERNSTYLFNSGGNLYRSNSIVIEFQSLPLPINLDFSCFNIYCDEKRLYYGVNILEVYYTYLFGAINQPYILIFGPQGDTLANISFPIEFNTQNYESLSSVSIGSTTSYPSNQTQTGIRNVRYFKFSVPHTNGSKKNFIKNSVINLSSLDFQSTFPIGGSPNSGTEYFSSFYYDSPSALYFAYNGIALTEVLYYSSSFLSISRYLYTPQSSITSSFFSFTASCVRGNLISISMGALPIISLPYPFGALKGNFKDSLTLGFSLPVETNSNNFYVTIASQTNVADYTANYYKPTSDTIPPVISLVEYIPLSGESLIIRVTASDVGSGVNSIMFSLVSVAGDLTSIVLDASDLVSPANGIYEKVINYLGYDTIRTQIMDNAYNFNIYSNDISKLFINSNLDRLIPSSFPLYKNGYSISSGSDFKEVSFQRNDVNISSSKVSNVLYVKFNNMQTESTIIFTPCFYPNGIPNPSFFGKYDSNLQKFVVPFTIPARLFSGIIDYTIYIAPNNYTNSVFNTYLGSTSQLRVVSVNADQLGPMIVNIISSVSTLSITQVTEVYFTFSIDDGLNKFIKGNVTITTEYDPIGKTFDLTPTNDNNYNISFSLSPNCRSQSYSISSATLIDESGIVSKSWAPGAYIGFDPLMEYISTPTIQVTCSTTLDQVLPTLLPNVTITPSTPIDPTGTDQDRTILIEFSTNDVGSGINQDYDPIVYISAIGLKVAPFPSVKNNISSDGKTISYHSNIIIPYGYGYQSFLGVAIFGIADNYLNIFGISNVTIINTITSGFKYVPSLSGASGVTDQGGIITLSGKRFGGIPIIQIDKQDGNNFTDISVNYSNQTGVLLVFQVPAISNPYLIRVLVNNQSSESLLITPGKKSNTGGVTPGATTSFSTSTTNGNIDGGGNSGSIDGGSGSNPTSSRTTSIDDPSKIASSSNNLISSKTFFTLIFILINIVILN